MDCFKTSAIQYRVLPDSCYKKISLHKHEHDGINIDFTDGEEMKIANRSDSAQQTLHKKRGPYSLERLQETYH